MLKVHILDRCRYCDGQAYVYTCEFVDDNDQAYPRYMPCAFCKGSGELDKWVRLSELVDLLEATHCLHQHTSMRESYHFMAGEIWDDYGQR